MVGSQEEENKNVGPSGFVDEIQASEPKRLAMEVQFYLLFLSNKCLPSANSIAVSVTTHGCRGPCIGELARQGKQATAVKCDGQQDGEAQCDVGARGGELHLSSPGDWRKKY